MRTVIYRSQLTSLRVKNKKVRHETKSSGVIVVLYTLWRGLLWSITVHTHGNLFVLYNKRKTIEKWKKKNKSADVHLTPSVCVLYYKIGCFRFKVRLHSVINRADFVSRCMLYTVHTKVTKCIREKIPLYCCGWSIKSHSPGYEIGPINRSV